MKRARGMKNHNGSKGKKQILVIEDDPGVANFLDFVLKEEGYAVELALGGEEGADKLSEKGYDLLILDLLMPRISGWDLLERLKEKTIVPPQVPKILVVSAITRTESKEELKRKYRICDYLEKPFSLDLLLDTVHRLLASSCS
jgi:DNA-binding response OmpR family regulator